METTEPPVVPEEYFGRTLKPVEPKNYLPLADDRTPPANLVLEHGQLAFVPVNSTEFPHHETWLLCIRNDDPEYYKTYAPVVAVGRIHRFPTVSLDRKLTPGKCTALSLFVDRMLVGAWLDAVVRRLQNPGEGPQIENINEQI